MTADLDLLAADLTTYLRDRDDNDVRVEHITPFGDGHSGITYRLSLRTASSSTVAILRLAPPGAPNAGPADIGRQGRIMRALASTPVPVPTIYAFDSQPALMGRSFALMERVRGCEWPAALETRTPEQMAAQAVTVLRQLRAVPAELSGLGPEDRVDLSAEVARWQRLLSRAPDTMQLPAARLERRLRSALPEVAASPSLVHGDFHFGNMVFDEHGVAGLLDWEIATLSSPSIDLASLVVAVIRRRYPDPNPTGGIDVDPALLVQMWGEPADETEWHVALACYKYAAIFAYNLGLHRRGRRIDPIYEDLQTTMHRLLEDGLQILDGGLRSLS